MTTEVKTTVPGNIWKVLVKEGDQVKKDDNLFIMEVMKTEVHHSSPVDGKVIKVNIHNDQEAVEPGDRKSTRLNSSHSQQSRMPSSA